MTAHETDPMDTVASELASLMRSHKQELGDAVIARMRNTGLGFDISMTPEALAGLRPAAIDSINVMIDSFVEGDSWTPTVPPEFVRQLKEMARQGASLEEVMRGFSIVGAVFVEFLIDKLDERQAQDFLRYMAAWQGRNSDRLMNAVAAEYTKEVERLDRAPARKLAERVRKVLDGGSAEDADLGYRLDDFHVGLIAMGGKAELICRRLAEKLGCSLLLVPEDESTVWAWLGARRQIDFAELERVVAAEAEAPVVAAGEPRDSVEGWRLTHREAQIALPVALLEGPRLTRCSDVALLAYALGDEAVGRSLLDRYLKPLDLHRDSAGLRETLRAYFELDCNAASTASSLGVNRHTIQRRLARIEQTIGQSLSTRRAELDMALRLEDLTGRRSGTVLPAAS